MAGKEGDFQVMLLSVKSFQMFPSPEVSPSRLAGHCLPTAPGSALERQLFPGAASSQDC